MPIYKVDGAKKDGLQKYNVRINYISHTDGKAKQLTRTAYGLDAAKTLENKLLGEVNEHGMQPGRKMTVQQLFEEYLDSKKYEVRECTVARDKREYRLHIKELMGNIRIDRLTVAKIQEWKISINQKKLALRSRQHAYAIFRATLNYAVRMEYLPSNPLLKVGNFKESMSISPEMKFYTAKDFVKFISTARKIAEEIQKKNNSLCEWDYYVFFNIAFYTGLRKGEINALKWSDIDGKFLSVKRSIAQKLKGGDRETPPKNKSSIRTIQMPQPLILVLNEHRKRQEQLEYYTEDYRICGGERPIRDTSISNKNAHYAEESCLQRIRIHDFRHSHVSLLANEGINIQEIARRLGHSKIEETWNTYSHLYPREEEKAIDILNRVA